MADYNSIYSGAAIDAAILKAAQLATIAAGDGSKSVKIKSDLSGYEAVDEYSNAAIDAFAVKLTGVQSIGGVKTFTSSPVVPAPTTALQAATKKYVDDSFSGIANLSFTSTVGSAALGVAVKGEDGNDASATNVVWVEFRSATITSSVPVARSITGSLAIILPIGATLGFDAAETGRLYVWAIDNAGTVELALSRTADLFRDENLVTTVAIGAGSDSATAMYSTVQRTDLACRCLGYIEIETGATAGEWDNAPSKLQLMFAGVKKSGDLVQQVSTQTGEYAVGSDLIIDDNSKPKSDEGDEYMTRLIVPTSALNILKIDVVFSYASTINSIIIVSLLQDSTADSIAAMRDYTQSRSISFTHHMVAGTTSSTTFKVMAGGVSAGTITFNGSGGARKLGGVMASSITISEIKA